MQDDLRYRIGGDTSGIDAAWAKIRRDAQSTAGAIGSAMGRARGNVEALMAPLRAVPALFAAIGATAVIGQMRQTAEAVADIGRQAKQAGLDVASFQELKFVAEQNRLGVDVLTDGMKELSLRADEFIATGKGAGAEAFGRLGYSSEELARKLKNPSALLTEIIGKLQAFDQAARIRISDEIFGGSAGERFVELIDQGEEGIRAQIQAAHDLGLVMDKELIEKAEEVDRQFNVITTTIGTRMKEAIVNATSAWFQFLDSFNEFEQQRSSTLKDRNKADELARLQIENEIIDYRRRESEAQSKAEKEMYAKGIEARLARYEELTRNIEQRENILADRSPAATGPKPDSQTIDTSAEFIRRFREELALSNRERQIASETQRILNQASSEGAALTEEQARALAEEAIRRREAEAATTGRTKASEKEAKAIAEVIAQLEHEASLLGATETQKRVLNELRRAGADAASAEGQRIAELVTHIEKQNAALERENQLQENRKQALDNLFGMGSDALLSLVDNSLKAEDALKRVALQLVAAAAQAALLNSGPLAGLFGGGGGLGGTSSLAKIAAGAVGLFDKGGWTGDGNPRNVAGLVHEEEFVVRSGPARRFRPMLEAMNAGRDIGLFAARNTMEAAGERTSASGGVLQVHVIGEEGPMFRPTIRAVSEDVAVRVSGDALTEYDGALPDRLQQINRQPRVR